MDDNATYRANLAGFEHIELRPRRLADISKTDTRVELFGATFDTPIFFAR